MKRSILILLLFNLSSAVFSQKMHKIPTLYINLFELYNVPDNSKIDTIEQFQISSFISFKEYKVYLNAVKKDSSEIFYLSQLPDSSIALKKETYEEYINNKLYEKYPVLGISWENAMNYCKWKTIKENKSDIEFVYRLPYLSEWLSAKYYFENNKIKIDIDKNYSDWLLNTFVDGVYSYLKNSSFAQLYNYTYYHEKEDFLEKKRKEIIGKSYLYNSFIFKHFYGFANVGYRYIAFRIVKVKNDNEYLLKYWRITDE